MIPRSAPSSKRRLIALQLGALSVISVLRLTLIPAGAVMRGGVWLHLLGLVQLPLLVLLATWFLRQRGLRWFDLGLRRPMWGHLAAMVPLGLVAAAGISWLLRLAILAVGLPPPDFSLFTSLRGNLPLLAYMLLLSWTSAAMCEELLFRGFVLDSLARLADRDSWPITLAAIIGQAVLFGALHLYQGIAGAIITGGIGLVLGIVWRAMARNLSAGIIMHGLIDSSLVVALYFAGGRS